MPSKPIKPKLTITADAKGSIDKNPNFHDLKNRVQIIKIISIDNPMLSKEDFITIHINSDKIIMIPDNLNVKSVFLVDY